MEYAASVWSPRKKIVPEREELIYKDMLEKINLPTLEQIE